MRKHLKWFLFSCAFLLLSGCGQAQNPAALTPSVTVVAARASEPSPAPLTPTPSLTPKPTATSTPTLTPTATLLPLPANAAMVDLVDLNLENVSSIQKLGDLWPEQHDVSDLAFYPGSDWLVVGAGSSLISSGSKNHMTYEGISSDTRVMLWNPYSNDRRVVFETGHQDVTYNPVAASPDGRYIAFSGPDHFILGTLNKDSASDKPEFTVQEIPFDKDFSHTNTAHAAVFSPDSRLLAILNYYNDVLLWDVQAGQKLAVLSMGLDDTKYPKCGIYDTHSLAFTPDGKTLLAPCNHTISLWDIASRQQASFPNVAGGVNDFALSPDGKILITGSYNGSVEVLKFPSGEKVSEISGHSVQVLDLAFSPDGSLLAASFQDNTVDLLDTSSWKRLSTLEALGELIAFGPHGSYLVTASHSQGGMVWGLSAKVLKAERAGVKVILSPGGAAVGSWKAAVPSAWLNPTGTLPRYEIRVISGWSAVGQTCFYRSKTGSVNLANRRQSIVTVQVTDLTNQKQLGEKLFRGDTPPECPQSMSFDQFTPTVYIDGPAPDIKDFLPWLKQILSPLVFK